MSSDAEQEQRQFEALLAAYHEAVMAERELPSAADVPEELAQRLREAQECVDQLHSMWGPAVAPTRDFSPDPQPDASDPPAADPEGSTIGRFRIERELGHGGAGIVFLATDPKLGRQVALKVPRPEGLMSRGLRQRFLREAEAAARLSHRHIVAVYEVGEAGPVCYIAAEYCAGPSLAEWLAARTDKIPPRDAAEFVASLASGVHHAHMRGVLHRDLKPSNVLLGYPSEPRGAVADLSAALSAFVPKVGDFGLAKLLERDGDETQSGTIMGTPRYMAPEQAEGRTHDIGVPTDVYALGAMLYELLTGTPPCWGATDTETLRRVLLDEPTSPRRIRADVPQDLDAICLKCLEKPTERRYATAAALEDDLRRYLAGQSTIARPLGTLSRGWKWARRRPALAALLAVSAAALVTIVAGTLAYDARLRLAVDLAEREAATSRDLLYTADLRLAQDAWKAENVTEANDTLAKQIPAPGQRDLREFAWHYLWNCCHAEIATLRGHAGSVHCVAFAGNDKFLATGGKDKTARLWDVQSGKLLRTITGHQDEVNNLAFVSPEQLATASDDGTVRLWDTTTGRQIMVLDGKGGAVFGLAVSRDGRRLATGGKDGKVRLWDPKTGALEWTSEATTLIESVAFSPDGHTLVTSHHKGPLRWWDVASQQIVYQAKERGDGRATVVFSPELSQVAAVDRSGLLRLFRRLSGGWEETAADELRLKAHGIHGVAFSPRDNTLATGTRDGLIQLWHAGEKLRPWRQLPGHRARIWSVAWSSNGLLLASAAGDGTVKLWNPEHFVGVPAMYPQCARGPSAGHRSSAIGSVSVSADGRGVITATADGFLREWDRDTRQVREVCHAFPDNRDIVARYPDGGNEVVAMGGRALKKWNVRTGTMATLLANNAHLMRDLAVSKAGKVAAVSLEGGTILILDVDTGEIRHRLQTNSGGGALVALTSNGRRLATARLSPDIEIWDTLTGRREQTLSGHVGNVHSLVFTSHGDTLVSGGEDETIRIWDVSSGQSLSALIGQLSTITALAISPDGRTLASGSEKPALVKLWDLKTHAPLMSFETVAGPISALAFTPDGRTLIAGTAGDRHGQLCEWSTEGVRRPSVAADPDFEKDSENLQTRAVCPGTTYLAVLQPGRAAQHPASRELQVGAITGYRTPLEGPLNLERFLHRIRLPRVGEAPAVLKIPPFFESRAAEVADLPWSLHLALRAADGEPLDSDQEQSLLESIQVFRDVNSNGILDPEIDTLVTSLDSPRFEQNIQAIEIPRLRETVPSVERTSQALSHRGCVEIFQAVGDYARRHGFVFGYPTFRYTRTGESETVQAVLLGGSDIKTIFVPLQDLDDLVAVHTDYDGQANLLSHLARAFHRWSTQKGFLGALPTYRLVTHPGQPAHYGITLLHGPRFATETIDTDEIGNIDDAEMAFRKVHAGAVRAGFVSGFPTFEVRGSKLDCVMIRPGDAEVVEIPAEELFLEGSR